MRYILGLLLFSTLTAQAQTGDWHVNANGARLTLSLAQQGDKYTVYLAEGGDCHRRMDSVTWDAGVLEFRRSAGGITQWYKVGVEDGVMVGRFSHQNAARATKPADPLAYKYHVTGWNEAAFPVTPAVFDINANGYRGRLRIDRASGALIGRLKFYAYENTTQEYPEEEIAVNHWDGETLTFTRGGQNYTGEASGRRISGSFTHYGGVYSWSGRRAEVLTYGLAPKSLEDRQAWQERTRRTLYRLMMAGNPAPVSTNVEVIHDGLPPISSGLYPARDDDPSSHPQNYTLSELRFTYTLPGGATRTTHAYFAKPNTPGPYPLVVAVNGHNGSAYQVMDGSTLFWYGDAWARRGYAVLAVDISHRPEADIAVFGSLSDLSTYLGYPNPTNLGDDPNHGNAAHPSIKAEGLNTDWEEDGERTWDVMRAIDWAVSRPDIDANKIIATGLSLGGEVASYVGALDPRVKVSIPAGYSPDLNVLKYKGVHCWHWSFADFREYLDQSDVLALIAPRALVVETGAVDTSFSRLPQPFAGDKQVMRRARVAYGSGPIFHFLHPLGHVYRAGVVTYTVNDEQVNGDTATDGRTLFDYVAAFLN